MDDLFAVPLGVLLVLLALFVLALGCGEAEGDDGGEVPPVEAPAVDQGELFCLGWGLSWCSALERCGVEVEDCPGDQAERCAEAPDWSPSADCRRELAERCPSRTWPASCR